MLPQDTLSTAVIPAPFLPPRDQLKEPLEDYELGGVDIQDSSQGLEVQVWRGRYIAGDIVLDVPGVVTPITVLSVADITEFQFTFDQNMQPFVAYVVNDEDAFYHWFDGTVPGFVTDSLPAGSITPRCSLDDKRRVSGTLAGASDIILTYMRAGDLYFRQQRDRYDTEYLLAEDLDNYELGQVGMNAKLRFQFQLVPIPLVE
jgi:hypothetical protein